MDAITLLILLFINQAEGCHALPANEQRIGHQAYLVLEWTCGAQNWKAWQRRCVEGQGYWGRQFFLEETNGHVAFYVNRFGELQVGRGALMENAYVPLCGS